MRYLNLLLILILFPVLVYSQQKYSVSGYVKDSATGEYLIGANVYLKEVMKGASTNQYGFYSITYNQGNYHLLVSFIGYKNYSKQIGLNKNITLNITLNESVISSKTIEVTAEREDKNFKGTETGNFELPIEKIKSLPAFLGEVDILKTIQLSPGLQFAGEGNTGLYVRGGGPDQNLILLDEAVVYNASHLFGFFSIFNSDAIKNVNLIKGGIPANYGGRLASVLDISMKEGDNQKYDVEGGIGLISSRLTVQGPIKKNTGSFIISARRTYIDILMKPFIKKSSPFSGSGYYFYDLNAKLNYRLSDKDRIFISAYFGRDIFSMKDREFSFKSSIGWGNATSTLRWNHLFNSKLFLNTSLIYTNYEFNMGMSQDSYDIKLFSGVKDWNYKMDFTYIPSTKHNIKFGLDYYHHLFYPNNASAQSSGTELDLGKQVKLYSHEAALYIADDFEVNEKIKLNAGIRYSFFQFTGPFDRYIVNPNDSVLNTIHYNSSQNIKTYNHLEPRFAARYIIDKNSSLKASFSQNYQYIHLTSMTSVTLPTDLWIPSSDIVKPEFGTQYTVGYYRNFKQNVFESYIEGYYKLMQNQIEFKDGAQPEDNLKNNIDNNLIFGKGLSYGIEAFLKKRTGKFNGWIGYTLSWTQRSFPDINEGKWFYAKYDRRHDVSIVLSYDMNEKWTFSALWVYASGNAITLPYARYFVEGNIIDVWGDRNSFRMPVYHRMDISATYTRKKHKKYESSWNFSVYNLYNRHNPFYIYFVTKGNLYNYSIETKAKQVSLFPVLPSVTWNFKF